MWRRLMVGLWIAVSCGCQVAEGPLDASTSLDAPDDALDARARGDAPRLRVPRDAPDAWREPDASLNECWTSEDCDDGIVCNGSEICGLDESEDRYECFPGAPCGACNAAGTLCCPDYDADGWPAAGCTEVFDCDDWNLTLHPGMAEWCDRRDQDCDGAIDEEIDDEEGPSRPDCDCDGVAGSGYSEVSACDPMRGFAPTTCVTGCWSRIEGDCEDDNPDRSPRLTESRCDGRDEDCDGRIDEGSGDRDGDGFFMFDCGGPVDCDDTADWVYPGAPERCDGRDGNCDRVAEDLDRDGHIALGDPCLGATTPRDDCDDTDARVRPGARDVCNGIDDDCDGAADGLDAYCEGHHAPRTECVDARCFDLACDPGWAACDEPLACTTDLRSSERHCGACGVSCSSGACVGECLLFRSLALSRQGTVGLARETAVRLGPTGAEWVPGFAFEGVRAIGGGTWSCQATASAIACDLPVGTSSVVGAVDVGSGARFACARTVRSEVWCWGEGRLGDGVITPSSGSQVRVPLLFANALAVGSSFACAVDTESVFCWGSGADGMLGSGATVDADSPVPVALARPTIGIAAGDHHGCALARDQSVWCWGRNDRGQLGVSDVVGFTHTPREVVGLPPVTAIVAAGAGTCVLSAAGERWCWGANEAGQLGDGTRVDRAMPTLVETGVRRLWLGPQHGCAETTEGTLRCWGENGDGRLGDGTTTDSLVPVVVDYAP